MLWIRGYGQVPSHCQEELSLLPWWLPRRPLWCRMWWSSSPCWTESVGPSSDADPRSFHTFQTEESTHLQTHPWGFSRRKPAIWIFKVEFLIRQIESDNNCSSNFKFCKTISDFLYFIQFYLLIIHYKYYLTSRRRWILIILTGRRSTVLSLSRCNVQRISSSFQNFLQSDQHFMLWILKPIDEFLISL